MTCVIGGGFTWGEPQRASSQGPSNAVSWLKQEEHERTSGSFTWNRRALATTTTERGFCSGGEAEEENSNQGSIFGRRAFRFASVLLKLVPDNQRTAAVPCGTRWWTVREWTSVRLSVGMRSPSCCAASLASSPGPPVKVFALVRANLHCLTLPVGGDGVIRCIQFCFLTPPNLRV